MRELIEREEFLQAFRRTRELATAGATERNLFYFQGHCLCHLGRHSEAVDAYAQEIQHHPDHAMAADAHRALQKATEKGSRPVASGSDRSWHTSLPRETLGTIQKALHHYEYRGVPMLKNPFDVALYPMLLWATKPRTLIEIGSKSGGSALWFGDQFQSFGIDAHVYSVDIVKVETVQHPRVTFFEGDGRNLALTFSPEFMAELPRPLLVIEDADHSYETSSAALKFFHPHLRPGEYIVIEDGIISDLENDPNCNSGPHRALKEFLARHGDAYEIDAAYCDFFGANMTWCTNGFLKRLPIRG